MCKPTPPDDTPDWVRSLAAKEDKALRDYEEPGAFGLSVSSIRELTDRTPEKWERELDRMERMETPQDREGELY
jgi:hypothetical protein